MNKEKPQIAQQSNQIKLILKREIARVKEGKKITTLKDPHGNIRWGINDVAGLMNLLGRFQSHLHRNLREQQQWLKIRARLRKRLLEQEEVDGEETFTLSFDEASFLKTYLTEIQDKDGKDQSLQEFEVSTRISVLEQLE